MNYSTIDDIYAAVGFGEISAQAVVKRIAGKLQARHIPPAETAAQGSLQLGVSAPGADGLLFRLSRCCCPVPGDEITGYITRGRGVTVHRTDCRNLAAYQRSDPERLMEVEWSLSEQAFYSVQLEIEALDRVGLLNDITSIISAANINIRSARVSTRKSSMAIFSLVIDVPDLDHLNRLMREISSLTDVLRVYRQRSA